MTVEVVNVEGAPMAAAAAAVEVPEEPKKVVEEAKEKVVEEATATIEKSSSYKEESNHLSDLKEFERKALIEFKSRLEEAILGNNLIKKDDSPPEIEKETEQKPEQNEETSPPPQPSPKPAEDDEKTQKTDETSEEKNENKSKMDAEISLWGVPLLPNRGAEGTDVILLKFLRAREFKVNEAFEMLQKTLSWRKKSHIDSILKEEFPTDLNSAACMSGVDREGHPVCYNVFGVFDDEELYQKTFGTEEKREQFLRWRCQVMEKGIQKLDLKPGGVSSLLQINDLKNSPGPAKKELRIATKQAVGILQDNYPELVAKNVSQLPFF